jgi:ABC-type uncharacterized transport system fused permease/ATPase subunit
MGAISVGRDIFPRGAFVVLVGPDGVGKTTVARALTVAYPVVGYLATVRPTCSGPLPLHPWPRVL